MQNTLLQIGLQAAYILTIFISGILIFLFFGILDLFLENSSSAQERRIIAKKATEKAEIEAFNAKYSNVNFLYAADPYRTNPAVDVSPKTDSL